jgi:nanoRNase/pAp phosphatase (c-di-AMP/oligoRNAs hydrolase)
MGNKKKEKGFWIKNNKETFKGKDASSKSEDRVGILRGYDNNQVAFVRREKQDDGSYIVTYSVAKQFKVDCEKAGIEI